MSSELLPAIAAFARVAHHASFTRAAAELGVSPSALSQTVRALEGRLGVRLLDRTTRRVGITEIGRRFLDDAQPALAALAQAVEAVNESRASAAGLLRVNLPRGIAEVIVLPHLADFAAAYPDVVVDLHCENTFIDLVDGGFDAGFRIGESLAQGVVAVPVGGPQRLATFASPAYVARHGMPVDLAGFSGHRCTSVRLANDRSLMPWEFLEGGRIVERDTRPAMVSNDGEVLLKAALAGVGIGCHFEALVRDDLAAGRLVPVLEAHWPTYAPFHVYYPSRMHVPRKLRVFIDFFRERHAPAATRGPIA